MELMTEEKKGFKKTKVGLIPEDWTVVEFGEITQPSGYKISASQVDGSMPCVELEHIKKEIGQLEGFTDIQVQKSLKTKFKEGDILFGKLRPYLRKYYFAEFEGVCSTEIWVFNSNEKHSNKYLYYLVQQDGFIEAANVSTGTHMPRADWGIVKEYAVPLPPTLEEQQAIASALSDVDELIRSLDRLIQKKQAIKKGTMQQLLTGKTRLPGFDGEWEVKKLGDIIIRADLGGNYSNSEKSSTYPLIKMGNLGRGKINLSKKYYINKEERVCSADKLEYGDLLLNTRNTPQLVGKVAIWRDEMNEAYYNSNLMKLEFDDEFVSSNFFMNYLLNTDRFIEKLRSIATGTTSVAAIYTRDLFSLEVSLPKGKEQKAIAQILSDMDRELQTLRQKREKYVQIKQGMMQELLTGKVRLI